MVVFTKKFATLDPNLPIVWDTVPKKPVFLDTFPYQNIRFAQNWWCIELVKPGTGVQQGELIVLIGDQLQVILVVPHWR